MAELAETLFLMGDRQAALRRYSDAEAVGVGLSLDMEFRRALCLYSVGRVDDAEKALKALTDDEPDFDAAHDALIGIYEESGQKRKASSAERRRKKHRSKQRRDPNADALLRFLEAELRNPDRW
jgi:predicted Zn-dependent protease